MNYLEQVLWDVKRVPVHHNVTIIAISLSSVETMTVFKNLDLSASSMVHAISGFPAKSLMFLRDNPFEPPRAGINPKILGIFI